MKAILFTVVILFIGNYSIAQQDSTVLQNLAFTGDFRFRVEHDWNSIKSDGTYREDRSRLRYRFRFGVNYKYDKHSSFGARVRSGNLNDQQGPHVTLGGSTGEFSLVSVGFEKLFYRFECKKWNFWIGKNDIPLHKSNELFWNDNVFPEGVGIQFSTPLNENNFIDHLAINAAHFISNSNNEKFAGDSYFQLIQTDLSLVNNKFRLYPALYRFKNMGNIPDERATFNLDYTIFHMGIDIAPSPILNTVLSLEWYHNLENYDSHSSINSIYKDQKTGYVVSLKYGDVKEKGNYLFHLYYAHLAKYAIVDYFAQNDWVRWDYSSFGATGSRISNFEGVELQLGYAIDQKFNLILRAYWVEELISLSEFRENGNRIRLDMNIGF